MRSFATALAALASVANAIDWSAIDYHGHYFRQEWTEQPLSVERLDPILQPGQIASHLHSFIGANAVSATANFDDTQAATCSQVYIKDDRSIYWMPSLFFQDPKNETFIRVPEHHRVLYYFNRASDPDTSKEAFDLIEEFPVGFKMIAGDSNLRAPAATKQQQDAVEWFCHGPDVKSSGFPANFTQCPNGLAGSIHFPYCWNGQDFDVNDPHAHMSYPRTDAEGNDAPDSGPCPASHPHILPHIFIEFWFNTDSFDGLYETGDTPWVISNGDPTGYSFHADFLSGWTPGVLEKQMKECNIGESGDPLEDCFQTYKNDEDVRKTCSQEPSVSEQVDGWLDALPGCNPIQHGPERAVMKTDCDDTATLIGSASSPATSDAPSSVAAEDSNANVVYVTTTSYYTANGPAPTSSPASPDAVTASNTNVSLPETWTASGCHSDAVFPRSLAGVEFAWWGEAMTSSGCAKYCDSQGFTISGTEYGEQCFCGDELTQSELLDAAKCDMPCKGYEGETCGGKAALSVFVKEGKSVKKRNQHFKKHVGGGASVRKGVF